MSSLQDIQTPRLILIIDDDLDIREALGDTLTEHGFEVVTAANGLEALGLLESQDRRPSVILVDLMMPVMDGYRFLDELQQNPALASIPAAVITAGYGIDRERLGESRMVIRKPIKVPQLLEAIRGLERASATDHPTPALTAGSRGT